MNRQDISRRTLLKGGGAAFAGLTVLRVAGPAHAFPGHRGRGGDPWLDQPAPLPPEVDLPNLLVWEELDRVSRRPTTSSSSATTRARDRAGTTGACASPAWSARPQTLTLDELKACPRREVDVHPGVLRQHRAAVLHRRHRQRALGGRAAGPAAQARGRARRGDRGRLLGRRRGPGDNPRQRRRVLDAPAATGHRRPRRPPAALDLTITEQFARSMSLDDALSRDNLLCYEMNGVPLPARARLPPCG